MTFAERLKEALWLRRMSQRQLARASGVTEAHISHLIHGNRELAKSVEMVMAMACALSVSIEWLVLGRGPSPLAESGPADTGPKTPRSQAIEIVQGHLSDDAIARARKEKVSRSVYGWIARMQVLEALLDTENAEPKQSEVRTKTPSSKGKSTIPPPTKKSGS